MNITEIFPSTCKASNIFIGKGLSLEHLGLKIGIKFLNTS